MMDILPPEVLHKIAKQLDFAGLAAFRQTATKYAAIGTEYLATTVRFHCSQASLDRLKLFVTHPIIRHKITTLKYEGNLIRDVGCIHGFLAYQQRGYRNAGRPRVPNEGCSKRERRLYQRNLAKWESEGEAKYGVYTVAYDAQQSLLGSSAYQDALSSCQKAFTKLENINLSTTGRCKHALSQRYVEDFPLSCDIPLMEDSSHSTESLSSLILTPISVFQPAVSTLPRLRSLTASVLTPSFFGGGRLKRIKKVFKSLKKIELTFGSAFEDLDLDDMDEEFWSRGILDGHLREALMAATELEHLRINFQGVSYDDQPRLDMLLGDNVWPKLKFIDVDHLDASDEYFLSVLRRHPDLLTVYIGYMKLTAGCWYDLTTTLRQNFNLRTFCAVGILEDPHAVHFADHIDVDAYKDDGSKFTLSMALDMYVADQGLYDDDDDDDYHPIACIDWQDEYELKAELEISDDDMSMSDVSHFDCD